MADHLSKKGEAWVKFSKKVLHHIEHYVIPQYGDLPDEFLEGMTMNDMSHDIDRYKRRIGKGVRGDDDADRDLFKIAHYANLMWMRKHGEL